MVGCYFQLLGCRGTVLYERLLFSFEVSFSESVADELAVYTFFFVWVKGWEGGAGGLGGQGWIQCTASAFLAVEWRLHHSLGILSLLGLRGGLTV